MTTHETKTWTCDNSECGKETERHPDRRGSGYIRHPGDPWLQINVDGNYEGVFHDSVKSHFDACCPECGIKILEKAIEKLKKAERKPDPRVL